MKRVSTFDRRYRCYVWPLDTEAFYDAKSSAQAKFKCWKAARDAGYKIGFGDIKVRLAFVAEESMIYFARKGKEQL